MPRTRSKSNRKSTPKKAKASAANMPVDAALALNITRFYSMAFFIGLTMFTDQFAAAYQVEVSTKNKIFMAFLGLNGFFSQCATNTFVGRIGHKKTMSLTCFANIVVFGLFTLHQTKTEYIDEVPFSTKIGMPASMAVANIVKVASAENIYIYFFFWWVGHCM